MNRTADSSSKVGRPRYPGRVKVTAWIDHEVSAAAKALARRDRSTLTAMVEHGLAVQVTDSISATNDAALAPVIDRLIQERHRRLEGGLRTMIARVAYEVIRTQYVLLNFITDAGIPPAKVSEWHKQGWRYAVKEFKRQTALDGDEEED